MNTRKIATGYRMAQWSQAIQERTAQGESIKDFCERRGINRNTYFYWQRRLREEAYEELIQGDKTETSEALAPKGWTVCKLPEPMSEKEAIIIEIGQGRIVVNGDIDSTRLEKVCRVMMKLC